MHFSSLLLLLAAGFSVASNIESTRCILSISEAVSHLSFTGSLSTPRQVDACTNKLRTYSLYAAATLYCSSAEIAEGLQILDSDCHKQGLQRIPYDVVRPELTWDYLRELRVVEYGEVPKKVELDEVVVVSRDWYWRVVRTNKAWAYEMWAHHAFGFASYWFWGIVLLSGVLNRFFTHFSAPAWSRAKFDPEGQSFLVKSGTSLLLFPFRWLRHQMRTYLIIPAALGSHHQRLFYWCSVPTRIEAIVIGLFYALSLILTCVAHDVFKGNLFWDDTFTQACRYVSDRTGIMSYANLSLLWLFGSRNNPFLWATGWSFSTFNLFHRAIARIATIQAIVHSIGYTILTLHKNKSYFLYWPQPWWYMGVVGTICMSLLLVFSSIWLRRNYYETFLLIHIMFSIVIIFGLFIHTGIFKGQFDLYSRYLWPVVIIWSLDRLARLARLLSCNLHLRFNEKSVEFTESVVSYNTASDIIRLEIMPGARNIKPRPGQHYFIYQPLGWVGYESHPFTVGSWSAVDDEDDYPPNEGGDLSSTAAVQSEDGTPAASEEATVDATDNKKSTYKLVFWIRPFDGWTKRLRSECLNSPKRTLTTNFLIEGPYYGGIELHNFDNVILIAGGTGIAAALPHVEDHLRRTGTISKPRRRERVLNSLATTISSSLLDDSSSSSSSDSSPSQFAPIKATVANNIQALLRTRTSNVTLIWTTRQESFIREVASRELAPALGREDIAVRFYCTSSSLSSPQLSDSDDADSQPIQQVDENTSLLSFFRDVRDTVKGRGRGKGKGNGNDSDIGSPPLPIYINSGRPDIKDTITTSIRDIGNDGILSSVGKTAILVCGPAEMADEARVAVHGLLKERYMGVEYFEETFGW
ncbi:hypothetical protein AJ79_01044 [Helicocarpus griseus UAMH5409]|uniref:FAD-binding FR-type domain-containing protein n=1 Tax=Helicocarpus griseus UAMH5409 TaxID=1447875 RepID=A0A2B7Y9Y8_9EURO|nr:hypothetical protein AJ79_01044 [Helicocarpus griseus UAMH5409]